MIVTHSESSTVPQIPPDQRDYWRVYHAGDILARFDALHQTRVVHSTGVRLHLDVYPQADPNAPVLLFNHGGGGYSRLFLPLALELFDAGYTVIVPDQRGQGLSEGKRGDFTLPQLVQNIVDAATWARETYTGPLFIAGGSQGGSLTYYAAAAGAPADAIVCHNLYDFGNAQNVLALSRFSGLRGVPGVPAAFKAVMRGGAAIMPGLRLSARLLSRFEKMVDERAVGFYEKYIHDPYPIRRFTMRYLASTFTTPPAVPLAQNTIPVLVINQMRDRMVSPAATAVNYERLGGDKHYTEIDYGHWAFGGEFEREWVAIADGFLRRYG